jgi:hypothetical protein
MYNLTLNNNRYEQYFQSFFAEKTEEFEKAHFRGRQFAYADIRFDHGLYRDFHVK